MLGHVPVIKRKRTHVEEGEIENCDRLACHMRGSKSTDGGGVAADGNANLIFCLWTESLFSRYLTQCCLC